MLDVLKSIHNKIKTTIYPSAGGFGGLEYRCDPGDPKQKGSQMLYIIEYIVYRFHV
jgi:hypothetical protein